MNSCYHRVVKYGLIYSIDTKRSPNEAFSLKQPLTVAMTSVPYHPAYNKVMKIYHALVAFVTPILNKLFSHTYLALSSSHLFFNKLFVYIVAGFYTILHLCGTR